MILLSTWEHYKQIRTTTGEQKKNLTSGELAKNDT